MLPRVDRMKKTSAGRASGDSARVKLPNTTVELWRPRIIVARTIDAASTRPRRITLEALASPAAAAQRLGTAQTVLGSLDDARASLARAADARAGAAEADSARERV